MRIRLIQINIGTEEGGDGDDSDPPDIKVSALILHLILVLIRINFCTLQFQYLYELSKSSPSFGNIIRSSVKLYRAIGISIDAATTFFYLFLTQ